MKRIIILFLLSAFTLAMSDDDCFEVNLGLPMIFLNCTTDYAAQTRSINVTWLLNSMIPKDIRDEDDVERIQTCNTSLACRNGHNDLNRICGDYQMRYGWFYDGIPLTENFCNVSISFDDSEDYCCKYYTNSTTCSFSDDINATVNINGDVENLTVGYPHEIYCELDADVVINSDLVNITWIGPDNDTVVNDSRIIVTTSNSFENNHTSTLQFLSLIEDDEGLYTCLVAIPGNTINESEELSVSIPTPSVNVAILDNNNRTVGSPLFLGCSATVVSGISSKVVINWTKNGDLVDTSDDRIQISDDGNYNSTLQFLYLSEVDEGVYTCNVTILNVSNSSLVELNKFNIPINVNGRAISQIVGDPLSLRCDVSIVRGITSNMDIVWLTGGNVIANYNDSEIMTESKFAYTLYYNGIEKLTLNDNNTVYQCQVLIDDMSFIDNLTLNVVTTDSPPVSSDDTSPNAIVISIIAISIALTALLTLVISIGVYLYLTKRSKIKTSQARRSSNQVQFQPFDDSDYSVIGKDDPSIVESLSANQKVKEWIKHSEMPTVDEECESVSSTTNEEMLNFVQGCTITEVTQTKTPKTTEFVSDSGVDSELDSGLGKISSKQNTYISHEAIGDMCYVQSDEINQPNPQDITVDSSNINNDQLIVTHEAADTNSPQSIPNFPNSMVTPSPSAVSPSANNSSYIDHYTATNNENSRPLPLHSTNADTFSTGVDGSYVDHYATYNASQPLPHHSNTTTTAEKKSYFNPYIALDSDGKLPDANEMDTASNQPATNKMNGNYTTVDQLGAIQQNNIPDDPQQVKSEHSTCATTTNLLPMQNINGYVTETDV